MLEIANSDLRGSPEKVLWEKAAAEKRIIVTRDLGFPISGFRPAPSGVILIRAPYDFKADLIAGIFKEMTSKTRFEELENKVVILSPGRIRISPLL